MAMTGAQRKHLRSLAHSLKPTVRIGKLGLTPEALAAVERALDSHELIKVRFLGSRDDKKSHAADIERQLACQRVGMVGHVGIFYRQCLDPDRRRVRLPD